MSDPFDVEGMKEYAQSLDTEALDEFLEAERGMEVSLAKTAGIHAANGNYRLQAKTDDQLMRAQANIKILEEERANR